MTTWNIINTIQLNINIMIKNMEFLKYGINITDKWQHKKKD